MRTAEGPSGGAVSARVKGEASPPFGLKSVAAHELEGLVGIGGEEEHAPVRVPSRGMTGEGDVLLDVDDFRDNVGGKGPSLDDASDTLVHA
jgi:hypothetical protein